MPIPQILWMGTEDIDFPVGLARAGGGFGAGGTGVDGSNSRTMVTPAAGQYNSSKPFPGGAVTSCWLSFNCYFPYNQSGMRFLGLTKSGSPAGLYLGTDATDRYKLALYTYDGTTQTQIAAEPAATMNLTLPNRYDVRYDVQIINHGASATVNVYSATTGALRFTYSGSTVISGVPNFDTVTINVIGTSWEPVEGVFVADSDTRQMNFMILPPDGAGTTSAWLSGLYTDINELLVNDATVLNTDTAGQDEQFSLGNLPSGTFQILATKVAARATTTTGAVATKVGLGYNIGGSVSPGTLQALTTLFDTYERYDAVNPLTSAQWTQSQMNSLQLNLRSGS